MIRKKRRWESTWDDDPSAGLINLFDVWVAFSLALLLALVSCLCHTCPLDGETADPASTRQARQDVRDPRKMLHYRPTDETLNGEGKRLGVAYRLQNGEVVYVPDGQVSTETTP